MFRLFSWFWNGLRQLAGLVLPVFSKARDFLGWSSTVKWVIHFILLALILIVLAVLNHVFEVDRFLGRAPKRPFEPARLVRWRLYNDYGTSITGDLFTLNRPPRRRASPIRCPWEHAPDDS